MHDNCCLYFKWNEDGILEISFEGENNNSLSNYTSFVSISSRISVLGDLAFFA